MNFPNLRGSVIDKISHKNVTFQCIKPYDTPNGRSLRVVCHHCDLECVLISWLPWQQISPKNLPKIQEQLHFSFHGNQESMYISTSYTSSQSHKSLL